MISCTVLYFELSYLVVYWYQGIMSVIGLWSVMLVFYDL
jgi:hypothetical protein